MDSREEIPPGVYGIGSSLNWDSETIESVFVVELPFRLLIPSCHLVVNHCGASVPVTVENNGVEIQRGGQYSSTKRNTVFIGGESAASRASISALILPGGGLIRGTKTLLYITAYPVADACEAIFENQGARYQDSYRYFASLANGHMPIVNSIINAYRRASVDPFAYEVTKWDVPNWFVFFSTGKNGGEPRSTVVCLYSGVVEDWYPTIRDGVEGEERPYFAASEKDILQHLSSEATPGEIDLLDGWSLFHSGRFADSIRSFVTAIEVLIEAEIRRLLVQAGSSEHITQEQLEKTRSNFDSRIDHYCRLAGRRLPGPKLSGIPYLNGIRLHDELNATRRLRHRIVHHGHRLNESYRGPMLRAAETTSWLFDWLATQSDFESRRRASHAFYFGRRVSDTPFNTDIANGRIAVLPLFGPKGISNAAEVDKEAEKGDGAPLIIEDLLRVVHAHSILLSTIGNDHQRRDIDFFVRMSLYELGLGEVEDSIYPTSNECMQERFVFDYGGGSVAVYCLESPTRLKLSDCEQVIEGVSRQTAKGITFNRVLVMYNDQYATEPHCRVATNRPNLDAFAKKHNLSLVNAYELALLVFGVIDYRWCHEAIVNDLLVAGCCECTPPHSIRIGKTYRFWGRPKVIGAQLESGIVLNESDRVAITIKGCMQEVALSGFKIDSEQRLTVAFDIHKKEYLSDAAVFKLDAERSYSSVYRYAGYADGPVQTAIAGQVVHPSGDGRP